jgi:hypothetical protein
VLIVAGVIFTLRGFVFHAQLTNMHPDILAFWLPRYAFLGRTLAAGHIPIWNPFEMAGYRYAADPQSGWLYVPAMAFFAWLDPGRAMRVLIVFNPLLAGLGLYWFLRKESLHRLAATAGGLSLAMLMSASEMAIQMPFAGFLAWSTLVLVGASGYRQADRWSRRLAWLALSAFSWSQVANAHMSHGLVMCSLLVLAYLSAYAVRDARAGDIRGWAAAGRVALFMGFLPLASLAVLIPRLAFIGSSSLHAGYDALSAPVRQTAGISDRPIQTNGVWAAWPLGYGAAPSAYAGAVILLASILALRARRWRALVWAFGGAFALTYVLMLNVVVTNGAFRALLLHIPFGDVYLHNVGRMRYLSMIAIPVLGAAGIQGLFDEPMTARAARRWLGAGVSIFLVLPLVAGAHPIRFILLAAAMLLAVPALYWLATNRARWAGLAIVVVLLAELLASGIYGSTWQGGTIVTGLEGGTHPNLVPQPIFEPDVLQADFMRPTAFVDQIRSQGQRYLTWVPPTAFFEKGYLFTQLPRDWPGLTLERGTLFGIPDVLGYNPVQLVRYWTYIRSINRLSVFYNASIVGSPTLGEMRLLGVRYLIVPHGLTPPVPGRVVLSADGYDLVEIYGWEPRASVVPSWTVVDGPTAALDAVREVGFDPALTAVVEGDPGITPAPVPVPVTLPGGTTAQGTATYYEQQPEHAQIDVQAPGPSMVVVRNTYDPGWSATVDGRPAPILPTDYLLQGVPVAAGSHVVELTYRDPAIWRGLAGSAVAWGGLAVALAACLAVERRRRRRAGRTGRSVPEPSAAG